MPGRANKGSLLLGVLALLMAVFAGIYLLAHTISGDIALTKLNRQDIQLEMLGLSGISRARFLLDNHQENAYMVDLNQNKNAAEKIARIKSSPAFDEVFAGGSIKICFSSLGPYLYVLASMGRSKYGYDIVRVYTCEYAPSSNEIVKVRYN